MKRALPLGIAVLALFTGVYVACAQQQSTRVIVATVATVEPGHMAEYLDRDMAHIQSVLENSTLTSIQQQTFESIRVLEATILNPVSFSPLR